MNYRCLTYKKIEDPGHGWLEVPLKDLIKFGVLEKITACSYYSHKTKTCYLEEDMDMQTFLDAVKAAGHGVGVDVDMSFAERNAPECFIRNLPSIMVVQ